MTEGKTATVTSSWI